MFYKRYEVFAEYFHPLGLIQSPLGLVTADSSNTELATLSSSSFENDP